MMEIIFLIILIILSGCSCGDHKKSIHFKIHVPEIIKHHIHTKTVFIHVHETKPHSEEKNHENYVEDWMSQNLYNYNNGLQEENHSGSYNRKKQKYMVSSYDDYLPIREDDYESFVSPYIYNPSLANENPMNFFDSSIDPEEIEEHLPGDEEKIHQPLSQYEIHENVDENVPNNDINYQKVHKEGYRHGMQTESGHVIHKNLKDFYDKENDEETFSNDGFEEENFNKYDAHNYRGKYDKEIGLEQRTGEKRADRKFIVAKMIIR